MQTDTCMALPTLINVNQEENKGTVWGPNGSNELPLTPKTVLKYTYFVDSLVCKIGKS